MPMNNRILRPLARPLLLDAVPGAAAAYSLRQLSNAYTGPVVTVRRSSDNAEADFKASEIDDGTLAAFCGAGDGLVTTWHDQSGNTGRDATNTTAAQQPKIVSSGSLVTDGGKAALEFDGSDDNLRNDGLASLFSGSEKPLFAAIVFAENSLSAATGAAIGFGRSSTNTPIRWMGSGASNEFRFDERNDANTVTLNMGLGVATDVTSQSLAVGFSDGNTGNLHFNGAFTDSHSVRE